MTTHQLPWLDTPWEPEHLREDDLEQVLDKAVLFQDATEGLFDRLGGIRITESDPEHGIELTVTLDGQLVGLTLSDKATQLGGKQLADRIYRLTQRASAAALSAGIAVLTPVVGIEVAEQLTLTTGLDQANDQAPEPVTRTPPADDDDYSTVQTWAVTD